MPRPKKDNKRLVMSFTIEPDLYEKIKDLSKERNITPSALVAEIVKDSLEGNKDKALSKPDIHRPENSTYKDKALSKPPNEEQDWTSRTIITVYNEQISVLDFMNRCIPRPSLNALRALREHSSWEEIADHRWPKSKNWKDTPIRV